MKTYKIPETFVIVSLGKVQDAILQSTINDDDYSSLLSDILWLFYCGAISKDEYEHFRVRLGQLYLCDESEV